MRKKIFTFSSTTIDLRGSSLLTNFFFQHYWIFDVSTKLNGSLNNRISFPHTFQSAVTLPIVLDEGNSDFKLKIMLNCLKTISLFTRQKAFLKKKLVFQQVKKKTSGFALQTRMSANRAFERLHFYTLTILPYIKLSHGLDQACLLSSHNGNISFFLIDISFFSSILGEKHVEWYLPFYFAFDWLYKKRALTIARKYKFFSYEFVWGMLNWIFWSSLNMKCQRGHGGWLPFSKFHKGFFFEKSIFFWKNFRF